MKTIRWQLVMEGPPDVFPVDIDKRMHFGGYADKDRECFVVFLLNNKNHIIAEELVTVGILNASLVHPREVFKSAITASAASIIIAHNHPSGDTGPSAEDRVVTKRLKEAGAILGIPLLDHVISGPLAKYFSFKEEGDL